MERKKSVQGKSKKSMIAKKSNKVEITAELVKNLRELAGASVMECKNALVQAGGDFEKAKILLKGKGKEKALKKSDRATREGVISSYIHSNKKIGTLVELRCETDFVAKNSEFQELAYDLAMHIAAMSPQYVSVLDVPDSDRNEYEKIARNETEKSGKTAEIITKIVNGKLKKHFEQVSLLSQPYIKNSELLVEDLIKEKISKVGENIRVERFIRYEL